MIIPTKKVKNDQTNQDGNTQDGTTEETKTDETTTPLVVVKDFPPPPDVKPDDNKTDFDEDEEMFGVKTVQDHICNIGGRSYVFKAGERVMVPFNVKCILSRANLLRG